MYLFGSIVVFFCTGVSMSHLMFARLAREHSYLNWRGTYQEVLPYLEHVFAQVIRELRESIRSDYAEELAELIRQLCNPDPNRRGHPKSIMGAGNQYSLERYVSIFGNLAKRAEYSLTRELPLKMVT